MCGGCGVWCVEEDACGKASEAHILKSQGHRSSRKRRPPVTILFILQKIPTYKAKETYKYVALYTVNILWAIGAQGKEGPRHLFFLRVTLSHYTEYPETHLLCESPKKN